MLHWMGFAESDIAAHYSETLYTGTKLDPAYTLGDIFGLFSSDVEWAKLDLEKNYLEPETIKATESLTAVVKP